MACFVDAARIFMHQNFRSRHPYVRAVRRMRSPICQPIRFRFGVVIEQRDELGIGRREALVVGRAEAAVLGIPDQLR
jgi:hypothetical protein